MKKLQHIVLVRASQEENLYGRFAAEILKTEGFAGFKTSDIDTGMPCLGENDLVVLTRCFLTVREIDTLANMVKHGASLICLQPSVALAKHLGWHTTCAVQYPGWIQITRTPSLQPIQAHVPVAGYKASDGLVNLRILAETMRPDGSAAGFPSVASHSFGKGRVTMFFYDLAAAIARIRFGDPELMSLPTTGFNWTHAADMFACQLEDSVLDMPQADIHAQLLAEAINEACPYPVPRLWYYPKTTHRSAAVFQSDDDGSLPEEFDSLSAALEKRGASATFYLMKNTRLDKTRINAMRGAGHTFGPHVNCMRADGEPYHDFREALVEETAAFDKLHGSRSATLQAHCAPWSGYMDIVPLHIRHDYRMLFSYLSLPRRCYNRFMCGSGRPMRFYDRKGNLHNCWQQPIITYDDLSIQQHITNEKESAIEDFRILFKTAMETTHTSFGILSHPVSFSNYSSPYIEAVLDIITGSGTPVFNGDQWLDFMERRHAVEASYELHENKILCHLTGVQGEMTMLARDDTGIAKAMLNGKTTSISKVKLMGHNHLDIPMVGDGREFLIEISNWSKG